MSRLREIALAREKVKIDDAKRKGTPERGVNEGQGNTRKSRWNGDKRGVPGGVISKERARLARSWRSKKEAAWAAVGFSFSVPAAQKAHTHERKDPRARKGQEKAADATFFF